LTRKYSYLSAQGLQAHVAVMGELAPLPGAAAIARVWGRLSCWQRCHFHPCSRTQMALHTLVQVTCGVGAAAKSICQGLCWPWDSMGGADTLAQGPPAADHSPCCAAGSCSSLPRSCAGRESRSVAGLVAGFSP